jgi:hypothetical protein
VVENVARQVSRSRVPPRPKSRERVLSLIECANLWGRVEKLEQLPRDFMRLLLAMPLRRGELHRLPVGTLAELVLDARARSEIWPRMGALSRRVCKRANWSWLKRVIDNATGLPQSWTFHDSAAASLPRWLKLM